MSAEFAALPATVKTELNGSVWLESARLALARELIDQNRLVALPALLTEVVRNSHARGLTQTRNLAVTHSIWSLRRLNRLEDARYWCQTTRDWQVADSRTAEFCAEPLTVLTDRDELFPVVPGALSDEDFKAMLSRINQLIQDRHEDPQSFPLNITLGRSYARLADHYIATGQYDLARPPVRQAAAIRDVVVARITTVAADTASRTAPASSARPGPRLTLSIIWMPVLRAGERAECQDEPPQARFEPPAQRAENDEHNGREQRRTGTRGQQLRRGAQPRVHSDGERGTESVERRAARLPRSDEAEHDGQRRADGAPEARSQPPGFRLQLDAEIDDRKNQHGGGRRRDDRRGDLCQIEGDVVRSVHPAERLRDDALRPEPAQRVLGQVARRGGVVEVGPELAP